MQTKPSRKFPHPLDGVEVGTVGRQIVESERLLAFCPPVLVHDRVVIPRVVGDHDDAAPTLRRSEPEVLHEGEEGRRIEGLVFALIHELAVSQTNGPEVADALASGMVEQCRVFDLGRDPHTAS